MKKKLLLFSLFILIVNLNAQDFTISGISYTIINHSNLEVEVSENSCYNGVLSLAGTVTHDGLTYDVKRIGDEAFRGCTTLTGINFPSSIEAIDDFAFAGTGIVEISIPNLITNIKDDVFSGCVDLETIYLPNTISSIGESAFLGCSKLTSINLPENLVTINEGAFEQSGLVSIDLPDSVRDIKYHAFRDCFSLTTINMGNGLTTIGTGAFQRCNNLTSVTLSESLTSIFNRAFQQCYKLKSIVIPNSVTKIEDYAFYQCYKLNSINLPNGITKIGQYAFDSCNVLEEINIPNSVSEINNYALSNNGLKKVTVNWQSPLSISSDVFIGNDLSSSELFVPGSTESLYLSADVWKDFGTINGNNGGGPTYTSIPDSNFEQTLIDQNIDSEGILDGQVLTSDISSLTYLNVSYQNISDLSGIEGFTALVDLDVNNNTITTLNLTTLTNLVSIRARNNNLTSLNVNGLSNLEIIRCTSNQLTALNLSDNINLTELDFTSNFITEINLDQNTKLEELYAESNQLETLDLSQNTLLNTVACYDNSLIEFNIKNGNNSAINGSSFSASQNPNLTCIEVDDVNYSNTNWTFIDAQTTFSEDCSYSSYTYIQDSNFEQFLIDENIDSEGILNGKVLTADIENITILDASQKSISDLSGIQDFTSLETLSVNDNSLTVLDVSQNTQLTTLNCYNNQLNTLELTNNANLETLQCYGNSIKILDLSNNNQLQVVKVNNNNLDTFSIKNGNNTNISTFDSRGNSNLTCIDVDDVNYSNSNWTDIDSQTIFSLDCAFLKETVAIPDIYFEEYLESIGAGNGIEYDGLANLASVRELTSVELYGIGTVEDLTGIQEFIALTYLNVSENSIENVDLSANTNLITLEISDNMLTSLDLSSNNNLKNLSVSNNSLSNLDVSNLSNLEVLRCDSNQISELDVTQNTLLRELNSSYNVLSNINLMLNDNLEQLNLESNSLKYIDLSQNSLLTLVSVIMNSLTGFNIQNGNNTAITNSNFAAYDNPNLTCILVDDKSYSDANWGQIDMQTEFSTSCPELIQIPDVNFEAHLESINAGNGTVGDGLVDKSLVEQITELYIANLSISDLTGIEYFADLEILDFKNNNVPSVNLLSNIKLEQLLASNNQLTSVDLVNNTSLRIIDVGENNISEIEVFMLSDLESLSCYKNQISNINLVSNKELLAFVANENELVTLDIRENINLIWLDVDDNLLENLIVKNGNNTKITTFSATGNPNLTCIEVDNVSFSETNWTDKDATATFSGDCAPANDDCSYAIPLVFGQQTPGDINSGTFTNSTDCVAGTIIADVWYSVIVPDTGEFSIEGSGFGGLLKFAIYESCTSTSSLSCGINISLNNLIPGTEYFLKVWMEETSNRLSKNSEIGTFTLTANESSVLSSTSNILDKNTISIYPNPANEFITVESFNNNSIRSIQIFNIIGKEVIKESVQKSIDNIDVSQLSKGVYLLRVDTENGIFSKKLIIRN